MIGYKCSTTRTTMNYCAQILNINLYKDNKQLCDYNSKRNMLAREARHFFCFYNRFHYQLRGIGGHFIGLYVFHNQPDGRLIFCGPDLRSPVGGLLGGATILWGAGAPQAPPVPTPLPYPLPHVHHTHPIHHLYELVINFHK